MNLLTIFHRYPDQEACIEHLENIRWGDTPCCPHCGGVKVARKADANRIGRWNCHYCKSSFNVLSGTIFEKTRIPASEMVLRNRADRKRQEVFVKLPACQRP